MTSTASFTNDLIVLRAVSRPEYNQEHITIAAPRGWDDVKKMTGKVLSFDGRKFTFIGWNSDNNEAYFVRPLDREVRIARVAGDREAIDRLS